MKICSYTLCDYCEFGQWLCTHTVENFQGVLVQHWC